MEDLGLEFNQDDIIGEIDWNEFFFDELPDGFNSLDMELGLGERKTDLSSSVETLSNQSPSPDSLSSWINDIENILMKDDQVQVQDNNPSPPLPIDTFFADVIVEDSSAIELDSNASDCAYQSQKEKLNDSSDVDADDPASKKRRRQLRNRDAAVRSRERKKVYVKDLEIKNRFLEGECRRLGRLLQCCYAENQSLRFSLQMGCASAASLAKQESAVLVMESLLLGSLLLGSLLWLVGIICLFSLPKIPQLTLDPVSPVIMVKEGPGSVALNVGRNKNLRYICLQSFRLTRRCKAARTRMKSIILDAQASDSVWF